MLHYRDHHIEGILYKIGPESRERDTEKQLSGLSFRYLVEGRMKAGKGNESAQLMICPFLAKQVSVRGNTITVKHGVLLDILTGPDKEYGHA